MLADKPVQRVHEINELEFEIEYYNLYKKRKKGREEVESIIKNFIRPFELSQAPLLRVGLIKEEDKKYVLMVDIHHIITDGTSMGILTGEFMDLYIEKELAMLDIRYKDFSEWQNSEPVREALEKQQAYWLKEFDAEIPVLELPTDYARPGEKSFEGRVMGFDVGVEMAAALRELARQEGATLYMILLAVFNILLYKLSGSEDILVGTPSAGRRHADLQPVIGMFVNTLAMRNYPRGDRTFQEFLREVKERTLNAFENQDYQFEDLVERLEIPRDTGRNPIFEVMFAVQNMELATIEIPQLKLLPYTRENHASKFDITMHVNETGQRLLFTLEYCTKLFKAETIERIAAYFRKVASLISNMPVAKISEIDIISEEERNQLLYRFNKTKGEFPAGKTIHGLFEAQVEKIPDHTALIGPPTTWVLTYQELNRESNQLARMLRKKGVGPDKVVGLMMERSFEMIIAILAIMKAGGAYLPVDPEYPDARKKYMLTDSEVDILLINNVIDRSSTYIPGDIEVLNISDRRIYDGVHKNPEHITKDSHLAYVIYTSGSTGKPKGVMLVHRNLVNLMEYHHNYTNINCSSVLQFATISFDASFHEIFSALLAGGSLHLIDKETRADIAGLFKLIGDTRLKTLFLPMSLLRVIFGDVNYIKLAPQCIEHIQTAGEQVIVNDAFREYLKNSNVYLHNHYGPSETHVVTALTLDPRGNIPGCPSIGIPILNTKIYILDKGQQLVPVGVPGELCIGGVMVGRGYLNNPELTNEKFIKAVIGSSSKTIDRSSKLFSQYPITPLSRNPIYITGDLAKWLPNGNIDFLGRIDHQVKIRGFRVEPGEIETRLLKHESIKETVVLTKEDKIGDKYLCAYIVCSIVTKPGNNPNITVLREFLSQELPDYMIPSYFVYLDKIPVNSSGKVNRKALPEPQKPGREENYTAPGDGLEEKLVALWSKILNISPSHIGTNDHFFQLGGHSLKATILISRIHKNLGIKVPLVQIFKNPSIKGLSGYIKKAEPVKFVSIQPLEKKEYYMLSSAQKRLYLLHQLDLNSTVYNLLYRMDLYLGESIEMGKLEEISKKLIVRHESLRTSFKMVQGEVPF
jgi:amino acid adenylation domain-containing protein